MIPYQGKDDWVEPTIHRIHECLRREEIPEPAEGCEYCQYIQDIWGQSPFSCFSVLRSSPLMGSDPFSVGP